MPEILTVINRLEAVDRLDCLKLLHFHMGSQISNITVIKEALREASQLYVQLAKLGAKMRYLNVGGGLAVDYDGSNTNFPASKNYNMQNYANDIVAAIQDACEQADVTVPTLISESGRAISAHQSISFSICPGILVIKPTLPDYADPSSQGKTRATGDFGGFNLR